MTPRAFLRTVEPRSSRLNCRSIAVHAGVRLNAPPHLGTGLTLASAFLLARTLGDELRLASEVTVTLLDNATATALRDPSSGQEYRRPICEALSKDEIDEFARHNYFALLQSLRAMTGVAVQTRTYSEQQADPSFRKLFLRSLRSHAEIKWCVSPLASLLLPDRAIGIRALCPRCGFSDRCGENSTLRVVSSQEAILASRCRGHASFEAIYTPAGGEFLDIDKIYRNILKEGLLGEQCGVLAIIVKGTDWLNSCLPVDRGLSLLRTAGAFAVGRSMAESNTHRFFTPVLTTASGVKLSKSQIQQNPHLFADVPEWALRLDSFLDHRSVHDLLGISARLLDSPASACPIQSLPEPCL